MLIQATKTAYNTYNFATIKIKYICLFYTSSLIFEMLRYRWNTAKVGV